MAKQEFKNYWQIDILPTTHNPLSQSVHWNTWDSEERFRANPTPGYTETSITYTYNSHGFRTRDFDLKSVRPRILFLGCSHTEGIGLKEEDTWVHKVSDHFSEYDCYNMGLAGSSGDTVARFLYNCRNILSPTVVFILWPDTCRFDTFQSVGLDNCEPISNGPWTMSKDNVFMFDEAQSYQNFMRNRAMVESLKFLKGFTTVELTADSLAEEFLTMPRALDRARDNHWAPSLHTYTAKKFLNLYEFIRASNANQQI